MTTYRITVWTKKGAHIAAPNMDTDGVGRFVRGLESNANQFFQNPGAAFPNAFVPFHAIDNITIEPVEDGSPEARDGD